MNTPSNAVPETGVGMHAAAPALPATRVFYWCLRRELWEYRSIYVAPLATAAVVLVGHCISTVGLPAHMRAALADPSHMHMLAEHYHFVAAAIMAVALIVQVAYCMGTLYTERRDRSILFWKSLPVSDLATVLAKATIAFFVLPLLAWVITEITGLIMLVWSSLVLVLNGLPATPLWTQLGLFTGSFLLLYHLVTVHIFWYAPLYGWLMLISAWARRAPFLWAVLPPFVIGVIEKLVFNSQHFSNFLFDRFGAGAEAVTAPGAMPMDPLTQLTPLHFLASPGLWLGLAFAAACLYAAARIRRYRDPV